MQGVASVALVAPLPGWGVDRTQPCTALHIAAGLGERGERTAAPGPPNHRYVMRHFLLWRHFCGIGIAGPACSPGASGLPTGLLLCCLPGSLALTHFSRSLSLSIPVLATSTGEQQFLLRLSLSQGFSPGDPKSPPTCQQPLDSCSSTAAYQQCDLDK